MIKIATDAQDGPPAVKQEKCVRGAPVYVRRRVDRGELLPEVEVMKPRKGLYPGVEREEDVRADAVEYVISRLPSEVFVDLGDMMLPIWDAERERE